MRVLLSRVTQAGAQQLLVHSENIFCAAKYLVPLAGSDLDAVRKKQQEASATAHWAPGREWASLQSRQSLPASPLVVSSQCLEGTWSILSQLTYADTS